MPPDPTRQAIGRLGAYVRWAKEDPLDPAGPLPRARAAFERRFLDEVDPTRSLSEQERNRRASHARKAYFTRLALASAKARRGRRGDAA